MGGFFGGGGGSSVDLASPPAIGNTTPNTGAFTTLSANNGTITTSSPAFTLAQTWNAGAQTFTALRVNATDTASDSGSLLMDLQVGGSSRFNFAKNGTLTCNANVKASYFETSTSSVIIDYSSGGVSLSSARQVGWANTTNAAFSQDVQLWRDAASVLALRTGTTAQTFRLYNTYTDASNYERGFFRWNTNVLEIGAEAAGTGTQRQLRFPLGTVTASTPLSITQTWNAGAVAFTAIQTNITSTAAASGSLFADFQVGGTSQCSIGYNGTNPVFNIKSTTSTVYSIAGNGASLLFYYASDKALSICFTFGVPGIVMPSSGTYGFGSGTDVSSGAGDVYLARDAANTLAQRNSTNAQAFKLYRTFTNSSNYERLGFLATNTTRYTITSENAGTGSARSLEVSFYTAASDPTSTDITSGCFSVWKNSGTGTIKLWANDGGTMKSVALA